MHTVRATADVRTEVDDARLIKPSCLERSGILNLAIVLPANASSSIESLDLSTAWAPELVMKASGKAIISAMTVNHSNHWLERTIRCHQLQGQSRSSIPMTWWNARYGMYYSVSDGEEAEWQLYIPLAPAVHDLTS